MLENPCAINPCKNNGSCFAIGSLGKYYCECPTLCNNDFNCSICNNDHQTRENNDIIHFTLFLMLQLIYFLLMILILLSLQRLLNWHNFNKI
jgi:hypothetical protein